MPLPKQPTETGAEYRERLARDVTGAEREQVIDGREHEALIKAALADADDAYDYLSRLLDGLGVVPGVGLSMVATQVDSLLASRIRENAELRKQVEALQVEYDALLSKQLSQPDAEVITDKADIEQALTDTVPASTETAEA